MVKVRVVDTGDVVAPMTVKMGSAPRVGDEIFLKRGIFEVVTVQWKYVEHDGPYALFHPTVLVVKTD